MRLALMLFWLAFAAHGADFDKGVAAFGAGDYATALRELKPLAASGDGAAQFVVGWLFDNGKGVPQDFKEAVKWYRLAAEQGDVMGQHSLGVMYNNGQGVPQDYKEAVKWFRLAADQGHANSQHSLGIRYYNGQGVPQDAPTAYMWWNIAAASGNKGATENREKLAQTMTPSQIEKGQDMTRACIAKNYKGC